MLFVDEIMRKPRSVKGFKPPLEPTEAGFARADVSLDVVVGAARSVSLIGKIGLSWVVVCRGGGQKAGDCETDERKARQEACSLKVESKRFFSLFSRQQK